MSTLVYININKYLLIYAAMSQA